MILGLKFKVLSLKFCRNAKVFFLFVILSSQFSIHNSFAQDLHFSQYFASPLNLNPSQTGLFNGDFRFIANQKTQWGAVTVPYKTLAGSFDARIFGSTNNFGMLCGGISLNSDKAGDSQLGLMQANGSLSFTMKLDEGKNFITIGAQGGYAQRSINYDQLIFDEQYDGDGFNATLPNGETFSANNFSYQDFSGGVNWNFVSRKSFSSNVGFAMFHLNEPVQSSFNNGNSTNLDAKNVLNANVKFRLFGRTEMIPEMMFEQQKEFKELIYGSRFRFGFEPKMGFTNAFYLGMSMRQKDAMIFYTGMDYNNLTVGISYDINTSNLKPASRSRGGLELSLIYIIKKVPSLQGPKKPCPNYL